MLKRLGAVVVLAAMAAVVNVGNVVYAQLPDQGVQAQPPITPGNCAKWIGFFVIGDAGKVCGSSGPCSNQLDFSQACNSQYLGMMRF